MAVSILVLVDIKCEAVKTAQKEHVIAISFQSLFWWILNAKFELIEIIERCKDCFNPCSGGY